MTTAPPKAPPPPPPRAANGHTAAKAAPNGAKVSLGHLEPSFRPPRIILFAVEGWGKTSCGAYAPEPAILMAKGENGYETLLGTGSVPSVPAAKLETWPQTLALLDEFVEADVLPFKTLVLDAMGGFERMCHEHVCNRDFGGEWGDKGFANYQKGYDVAVTDWIALLTRLDRIYEKGAAILMLGHTLVKPFKNPMGADFDRYVCDVHHKTWGPAHKWADAVLFGNYITLVEKDKPNAKKGKGVGGSERILYAERRDAFDAKNRYRMPPEIEIPNDPAAIWTTIIDSISHKEQ